MIDSTLEYLYQLHNRGIKLGLENVNKILNECDNPHNEFKSIHLAGTNGKGSTASIIAKILQNTGLKVGLYTSPHLINFNERIRINGHPISNNEIINFTKKHRNFFEKHSITFFEATTALAFDYFRKSNVGKKEYPSKCGLPMWSNILHDGNRYRFLHSDIRNV